VDRKVSQFAILFAVSFGSALIIAWPSLRYPWFWDDYHLIRAFGADELMRALRGPWDLDNIESVSYRPLWVVANHARAVVLGESILLHRLFLLGVLAVFTALVTQAAVYAGLISLPYAAAAAAFSVLVKSNHANLMWLTDATHALSGIPVALCCFVPLQARGLRRVLWPLICFLLAFVGVLVREDIAALFPVVVGLQAYRALAPGATCAPQAGWLRSHGKAWLVRACLASVPLLASLGVYFWLRRSFVPGAVTAFSSAGFLSHATMTFHVMGTKVWPSALLAWRVCIALLLGAAILGRGPLGASRVRVVAWLACALVGCLPGLVQKRSNLLMVPSILFMLALAMAVEALQRSSLARPVWLTATALAGVFAFMTGCQTRRTLLCAHPQSLETVQYTGDFLYGVFASRATIPRERRAYGEAYLRGFGIVSNQTFNAQMERLRQEARGQPKRPNPKLQAFTPPYPFLSH
jgi:hypothetical protein